MARTRTPQQMPSEYHDELVQRCFPHRFRRIGSPHGYLDDVGIVPILEFIMRGHLLHDVAEAVNVPLTILKDWAAQNNFTQRINEAETVSAEGYLAEGMARLRKARNPWDLSVAQAMIKNAQFMASKKDKPTYGETASAVPSSPVTYIFDLGGNAPQAAQIAHRIIDATSNRIAAPTTEEAPPTVSVDLGSLFGIPTLANDVPPPTPVQLDMRPVAPAPPTPPPDRERITLEHTGLDGTTSPSLDPHLKPTTHKDKPSILAHIASAYAPMIDLSNYTLNDVPSVAIIAHRPVLPTPKSPDIGPFYDAIPDGLT